MKKSVLFVNASLTDGGSERVMTLIANELSIYDSYDVHMLVLRDKEKSYSVSEKVTLYQLHDMDKNKYLKLPNRLVQMRHYIKSFKGDYVIVFMDEIALMTVVASLGLKKKIIVSIRNNPKRSDKKLINFISKNFTLKYAHKVVFQTQDAKQCYSKDIQRKGCVIPNPINNFLPKAQYNPDNNVVVCIGRLEPQKNFEMAIKAFGRFVEKFPEYKMQIYGRGQQEDKLKQLIGSLGLSDSISLKGFVTNVPEVLKQSSIYVSSSDFEGISNTMLEAMAMGVPVICTDCPIGGARMMIDNNKNGFLIPVGGEDELVERLTSLAKDKMLLRSISMESQKIRDNYSINRICDMWIDCLSDI